ncbi:hypothetical protein CLV58_109103 [Spirosoma oryzae]|uniref:Uncharacterized protein n=1 Tax=Spirosoma oryzae TaxID=1469603 RepID=A0A2T0SY84_9BACT|nr:hypothetical protein [Spirosoma oryzae]PRY38376.1 hypothetical protein CLV58_109103 [Spirosoma oryzae]
MEVNRLKPGDWVQLVNTDSQWLQLYTNWTRLAHYRITQIYTSNDSANGEWIKVAGINSNDDPKTKRYGNQVWIEKNCFIPIDPFQAKILEAKKKLKNHES